jgi:hypothetical protein
VCGFEALRAAARSRNAWVLQVLQVLQVFQVLQVLRVLVRKRGLVSQFVSWLFYFPPTV